MEVVTTDAFEKALAKLPTQIKRLYRHQFSLFISNWRDTRLHTKKIKSLELAFSFRITRRYRVLFYFQAPKTAIFFDVDHRKDVYR